MGNYIYLVPFKITFYVTLRSNSINKKNIYRKWLFKVYSDAISHTQMILAIAQVGFLCTNGRRSLLPLEYRISKKTITRI